MCFKALGGQRPRTGVQLQGSDFPGATLRECHGSPPGVTSPTCYLVLFKPVLIGELGNKERSLVSEGFPNRGRQTKWLKTGNLFSCGSRGQKPQIQMSAGLFPSGDSGEESVPGLCPSIWYWQQSLVFLCNCIAPLSASVLTRWPLLYVSSHWDISPIGVCPP